MLSQAPTLDRAAFLADPALFGKSLQDVSVHLRGVSQYYPGFAQWFDSRVTPGLLSGERAILLEYRDGRLGAAAIIKHDAQEKKLCCLRVAEPLQSSGLGVRLFERSMAELQTERPLLSVADESVEQFDRIFRYFGYDLTEEYEGLYRPRHTEFVFNGTLHP